MTNKRQLNKIVDQGLEISFKNNKLDTKVVNRLVKDFKSMHLADSIYTLSLYAKGLKRLLGQQTASIEAVVPLSAYQLKTVRNKLSKLFTITQTRVTINPNILGGLRITVGDTVLDYSIRSKLDQVKEAIVNG